MSTQEDQSFTAPPSDLDAEFQALFKSLVAQVIARRQMATASDIEMIRSAVRAARGEKMARDRADELYREGDYKGYARMTRMALSERSAKSQSLTSLSLIGSKQEDVSKKKMREHAAQDPGAVAGGASGKWTGAGLA